MEKDFVSFWSCPVYSYFPVYCPVFPFHCLGILWSLFWPTSPGHRLCNAPVTGEVFNRWKGYHSWEFSCPVYSRNSALSPFQAGNPGEFDLIDISWPQSQSYAPLSLHLKTRPQQTSTHQKESEQNFAFFQAHCAVRRVLSGQIGRNANSAAVPCA